MACKSLENSARQLLVAVLRNPTARKTLRGARTSLNRAAETVGLRLDRRVRGQLAAREGEITALRRELERLGGAPSGGSVPVFFVVGQKKSGTTWLMRMLDAHPEILCRGEGRIFGGGWRKEALKDAEDGQLPTRSTRRCSMPNT